MTYPNGGQRDEMHPNRKVGSEQFTFSPDRGVQFKEPIPMPLWMIAEIESKEHGVEGP